jgi:hypothetical protein
MTKNKSIYLSINEKQLLLKLLNEHLDNCSKTTEYFDVWKKGFSKTINKLKTTDDATN